MTKTNNNNATAQATKKEFKGASFPQKKALAFILRHKMDPTTGQNILTEKVDKLLTRWFINEKGKIDAYAAKGIPTKSARTIIMATLPKARRNAMLMGA